MAGPTTSPFRALPNQVDLPRLDRRIIEWWADRDVFEQSLRRTADGPRWVFYEGPPTANGAPGTHHVEARVFKDLFPRYRTMRGYSVPRRAGWDCHGLPVELAVEKELGLSGKPDIERLGIAEFNAHCRESVLRHVGEFEATHRADGLLDRPRAPVPDDVTGVCGQRLVGTEEDLRPTDGCPRTTGSRRTAPAAAPPCPTTRSPRATRTVSPILRSPSGSRWRSRCSASTTCTC